MPVPLRRVFAYRLASAPRPEPGARVRVPFGRQSKVGVVVDPSLLAQTDHELKAIEEVLDEHPVLDPHLVEFCRWLASYYHHPLGEVLHAALPTRLRRSEAPAVARLRWYALTEAGRAIDPKSLGRARRQQAVLRVLQDAPLEAAALRATSGAPAAVVQALVERGWIEAVGRPDHAAQPGPPLNDDQRAAVAAITADAGHFHVSLLHGVTGSGKTE
ncbi:MAG: primosomal protein N', partial [Pseudomonadota bacterium]